MGVLVLLVLTSFAAIDALGAAVLATSARVERFVVAMAVFFALIAAPSLLLGYLEVLTPGSLALASSALFAATFFALARALDQRSLFVEIARAARDIAWLPIDAARECVRARTLVLVPVVWASLLAAYEFFEAWRVPNVDWDALIYHEPIVGFALQNHGFAMVHLPPNASIQAVNGYPKLCEMTSLWFVAFTDRTLMELPNVLAYPALVAAAYLVFRRFADRTVSMGLASVLAFMPQIWAQLCLMAIDVEVAFFAVFGLFFATRSRPRLRDVWCTWLAAALLVTSKGSGLAIAALLAGTACVRAFVALRDSRRRVVASAIAGAVLVAAVGCVPYMRNWHAFHNPLWPVTIRISALGIDWKGILTVHEIVTDQPIEETFKSLLEPPGTGLGDVIRHGLGYAIPWVVFPFALLALVVAAIQFRRAKPLAWIIVLGVVFTATTPTLGRNMRYNIHILVCVMALVAWLLERVHRHLREGIFAVCAALSFVPLFRMNGWLWSSGAAKDAAFLAHPFGSREHIEHARFELVSEARDAELHAGDVAAVDWPILFVGELWSFDYSNRLEVLECDGASCIAKLDAVHAKWIAAASGATREALDANAKWERIGHMTSEDETTVYRRR